MPETPLDNPDRPKPFVEHPTGHFATAIYAMADAIQRLRSLPKWSDWITFRARSVRRPGTDYHFAEIRVHGELVDPNVVVDVQAISRIAHVEPSLIIRRGGVYQLSGATPDEMARILDAIFRHHLTVRPVADEGDDYAVSVEW